MVSPELTDQLKLSELSRTYHGMMGKNIVGR